MSPFTAKGLERDNPEIRGLPLCLIANGFFYPKSLNCSSNITLQSVSNVNNMGYRLDIFANV